MSALTDFLHGLLITGSVVLRDAPESARADREEALTVLAAAHARHALTVAGPPLAFDVEVALWSTDFAWWACWLLVNRTEPPEAVAKHLPPRPGPRDDPQHLSADVVLRLLPFVHRRARALAVDDPLTLRLAECFRQWPLSGILADLDEAPSTPPNFAHPGLCLLYAERLADHPRPAWLPAACDHIDLVFAERGLRVPAP